MKLADIHLTLGEVRKERGISQKGIAEMLNVEQATVSLYENGKRGIPLDILDQWLALLEIDWKITPKGYEPVKPELDIQGDLELFGQWKRRRNYLIAELRALQAGVLVRDPVLGECKEDGELRFWPYADSVGARVGLIETRWDHPQQKVLAVEYTADEVNVYKHLADHPERLSRLYFTEEDLLGTVWGQDELALRKVTLLRKDECVPDGVELIGAEGFSLRSLLDMQEHFLRYDMLLKGLVEQEAFVRLEAEKEEVYHKLMDLSLRNRLGNLSFNPRFVYWTEEDREAIDVPLWSAERNWKWIQEGVQWEEVLFGKDDA